MLLVKEKINHWIKRFPNIWKTLLFNFYYLPFKQAVRLPIFLGNRIIIKSLGSRNSVFVNDSLTRGSINLGIGNGSYDKGKNEYSYWEIGNNGIIKFDGACQISKGFRIHVRDGAILKIWNGFSANANSLICCDENITIGAGCMLGWNVSLMDTDLHRLYNEKNIYYNQPAPVHIGDFVWISADATILKGCCIGGESVIAKSAVVSRQTTKRNCLLAGNPAVIVKENINWSRELCKG